MSDCIYLINNILALSSKNHTVLNHRHEVANLYEEKKCVSTKKGFGKNWKVKKGEVRGRGPCKIS